VIAFIAPGAPTHYRCPRLFVHDQKIKCSRAVLGGGAGVPTGSFEPGVPEKFGNDDQVGPPTHEGCCKRVPTEAQEEPGAAEAPAAEEFGTEAEPGEEPAEVPAAEELKATAGAAELGVRQLAETATIVITLPQVGSVRVQWDFRAENSSTVAQTAATPKEAAAPKKNAEPKGKAKGKGKEAKGKGKGKERTSEMGFPG
jgi:hypothetical protein